MAVSPTDGVVGTDLRIHGMENGYVCSSPEGICLQQPRLSHDGLLESDAHGPRSGRASGGPPVTRVLEPKLENISLGRTGRTTTRLGFGCSSIMGSLGWRDSLAVLEAAWGAGIRHFDVAPMYGYGEAESCLGEFLSRHPNQVTVTTKFGIPGETGRPLARLARAGLRPLLQRFPALKERLSSASAAEMPALPDMSRLEKPTSERDPNPIFNAGEAKRSLERSLRALRCDRIDVWLLHEVTASDLVDDALLGFLEDSFASGVIGTYGVGTDRGEIGDLLRRHPEYCPTLQYEWSIFHSVPATAELFRIHHRSLTSTFRALHAVLASDKECCSRWSRLTGVDVGDAAMLSKLMLKAAFVLNPESVILFSSKNAAHVRANADLVSDNTLAEAATTLYEIVQSELVSPGQL